MEAERNEEVLSTLLSSVATTASRRADTFDGREAPLCMGGATNAKPLTGRRES